VKWFSPARPSVWEFLNVPLAWRFSWMEPHCRLGGTQGLRRTGNGTRKG
jgi:hypothetical protein